MMPEGQDFITLNNLNYGSLCQLNPEDMKAVLHHYKLYHADAPSKSTPQLSPLFLHSHLCYYLFSSYMPYTERFWGFITAHWHDLKAQKMAYQKADSAAQEAPVTWKSQMSFTQSGSTSAWLSISPQMASTLMSSPQEPSQPR